MATILDGVSCPDDGIKPVTMKAGASLTDWQYRPVYLSADRTVSKQTTAGGPCYGILQNAPASGGDAIVKTLGHSFAYSGGTCTVGLLGTIATTTGDFVDNTGSDKEAPVRFIEGSTTDGDRIVVEIVHGYQAS